VSCTSVAVWLALAASSAQSKQAQVSAPAPTPTSTPAPTPAKPLPLKITPAPAQPSASAPEIPAELRAKFWRTQSEMNDILGQMRLVCGDKFVLMYKADGDPGCLPLPPPSHER
jgi:hypothetical protein